jgi:glycerol-3-phosphate dehydrogenase (NAD+)
MARFCSTFFQGVQQNTILESCGIADLITTCYGGRNRRCGEEFAKLQSGYSTTDCHELWNDIESKLLNGQKLQGTLAAKEVYALLESRNLLNSFPLFRSIYEIAFVGRPVLSITAGIHVIETSLTSKL